jgi:hypothetical protein
MPTTRLPLWFLMAAALVLATCSSPSASNAPPAPNKVDAVIRVVDVDERWLSGATIWVLDSERQIVSKRMVLNEPVRFILEMGIDHELMVHIRNFLVFETVISTWKDAEHTITLRPSTEQRTVDVTAKWSNGETAPVTGLKVVFSYRDVDVDSFSAGTIPNRFEFPVFNPDMQVRITAADSDTLKLSMNDLSASVTAIKLNRISPPPAPPDNSPSDNLQFRVIEFMTGNSIVANVTITEKNSGLVATYDETRNVFQMTVPTRHKPYVIEVGTPGFKMVEGAHRGPYPHKYPSDPPNLVFMHNLGTPLVELFTVPDGHRWAFQKTGNYAGSPFEQIVFLNQVQVGNQIHYSVRTDQLTRHISGSDTTWSILSSKIGTIIETEFGLWLTTPSNSVFPYLSIPSYLSSSHEVTFASGSSQHMQLPLMMSRKVLQGVLEVNLITYTAGSGGSSLIYNQQGLTRWNTYAQGGHSVGSSSTTITRISTPALD